MKNSALLALASGLAIAAATPADAAITITVFANGTQVGTATDNGSGFANFNQTTGGYFYNIGATGFPLLTQPELLTQSVNVQTVGGANGVIDVYITQSNLNALTGGLGTTFTSNTIKGVTATLSSYWSQSGAIPATTPLQTATFTTTGVVTGDNVFNPAAGWSETVRYSLNFTGGNGSNFNGTVNLSAVPEPATWAMMLIGFGATGAMMRRRKQAVRVRFA